MIVAGQQVQERFAAMYLAVVLLTMLVLPSVSVLAELVMHPDRSLLVVVGRWFVFWGVGVRLLLAGLRQLMQPQFTARSIFHMTSDEALPLVRELGIANLAIAAVALSSLSLPSFVLPTAVYAGIFYGLAGIRHAAEAGRSWNETIAMVSDLIMALVMVAFMVATVAAGNNSVN